MGDGARPGGVAMTTWTDEETEIARELVKRDAHDREFRSAVGRSKTAAKARLDRVLHRSVIDKRANPSNVLFKIPVEVIEERERRLKAQRSLTAILMGDPPFPAKGGKRSNTSCEQNRIAP